MTGCGNKNWNLEEGVLIETHVRYVARPLYIGAMGVGYMKIGRRNIIIRQRQPRHHIKDD